MDEKNERFRNLTRPPLFDGTNFAQQKVRMIAFIQGTLEDDVWDIIKNGYIYPTKPATKGSNERIKKVLSEFTQEEKQVSRNNNKGNNAIFMSINEHEFKRSHLVPLLRKLGTFMLLHMKVTLELRMLKYKCSFNSITL